MTNSVLGEIYLRRNTAQYLIYFGAVVFLHRGVFSESNLVFASIYIYGLMEFKSIYLRHKNKWMGYRQKERTAAKQRKEICKRAHERTGRHEGLAYARSQKSQTMRLIYHRPRIQSFKDSTLEKTREDQDRINFYVCSYTYFVFPRFNFTFA